MFLIDALTIKQLSFYSSFINIPMNILCDVPFFVREGSPAYCFHAKSTRIRKKLTSTCQFSAITLLTSHSGGLLLLSSLFLTLQSSERAHFIVLVYVYVHECPCLCVLCLLCVFVCMLLLHARACVYMCVLTYVRNST